MAKFRKRPVVIEAFRWTGGPDQEEAPPWLCKAIQDGTVQYLHAATPHELMLIYTMKGTHHAQKGDWIIRGVKGELYSCKPDVFEATYEPVKE